MPYKWVAEPEVPSPNKMVLRVEYDCTLSVGCYDQSGVYQKSKNIPCENPEPRWAEISDPLEEDFKHNL
jgi:hypothetical protein